VIVRFFKRRYWNYVVAGTEMWLCSEKDVVNLVFIIKVRIIASVWWLSPKKFDQEWDCHQELNYRSNSNYAQTLPAVKGRD